jgi:hypothetical protein
MHVLLIDPDTHSIEAIDSDLDPNEIRQLLQCDTFGIVPVGKVFVYHDDVSLYRPVDVDGLLPATAFKEFQQPIVGRVLCVGWPNASGEDMPCPYDTTEMRELLEYVRVNPKDILSVLESF